ncbi:MAG: haloacid dehalogenase type II [Steroidobacteraceae bacterium]
MSIHAVLFDAYGTLYDVQSVRVLADELCGDQGELVTQLWRLKQLEYTWLRTAMDCYEDFWQVTREALLFALAAADIEATPTCVNRLTDGYLNLAPYPETAEALEALRRFKLAILSNGSTSMLEKLVSASGFTSLFAEIISVDRARHYKPHPACYALAAPALGVATSEILFVSSNGFDVAGAKNYGFTVAWIERGGPGVAVSEPGTGISELYRLLRGRQEQLGLEADYRLRRLTDLEPLLR